MGNIGKKMNKKILLIVLLALVFIISTFIFLDRNSTKDHTLTIGCISIFSGEIATYGKETKQGIALALDEINNSNILQGKELAVQYEDSQFDAKMGVQAINKLILVDKVPIILGAFSSRVTLAIAPIAEKYETVLMSASATADSIKNSGDYIFRIVPPNKVQGEVAAFFARENLKAKKAAVYYVNDEYGQGLSKEFTNIFTMNGGKVLFSEGFSLGQKDFRTTLQKIKKLEVDILYFPGQAIEIGLILKQSKEIGLNTIFVGADGSYSPDLIKIASDAASGAYFTLMSMGFGVSDDMIKQFNDSFKKKYNEEPTVYAAYAYDAMKIIGQVISKNNFDAKDIKKGLYDLEEYIGVTGLTKFDQHGEVDKNYYVYEIKDNKFILSNKQF